MSSFPGIFASLWLVSYAPPQPHKAGAYHSNYLLAPNQVSCTLQVIYVLIQAASTFLPEGVPNPVTELFG